MELVHGRCKTQLLDPLIRLRQLAIECEGDPAKFRDLVIGEEVPDVGQCFGSRFSLRSRMSGNLISSSCF